MDNLGKFTLFNSTGLPKTRCEQIKRDLLVKKPLLLALNETKLTDNSSKNLDELLDLSNKGYNYKLKNRPNNPKPGGGVALIYRDNLNVKEIDLPSKFKHLETLVCDVSGPYIDSYTFATYYNSPNKELNIHYLRWLSKFENLLFMSDINSKHPKLFCKKQNKNGNILIEALESNTNPLNLCYINDSTPTKRPMRKNEDFEILDMVFGHPNIIDKIMNFEVGEDYGSHHMTVTISIPLRNQTNKINSNKPNFKKADWPKFKTFIDDLLPDPDNIKVENKLDLDILVKQATSAIEEADENAIPRIKYKSLHERLPPKIKHLLKVKRKLVKDSYHEPWNSITRNNLIEEIKELNKIINQSTNQLIKDDWAKSCDQLNAIQDSKKYWAHFSRLVGNFNQKVYSDLKFNKQT